MRRTTNLNYPMRQHNINVLLVDDQIKIAEAIQQALNSEKDIELHYCQDPSKAIRLAAKINATVILQDLVMPEIDGLMMVRYFRANAACAKIPIIVLSAGEEASFKSEAFMLGANDYLVKLPDTIELIARIRYHSQAYINQLERDEAFRALKKSQAQLAEANRNLQKLSSIDSLTGLANRRIFDESLRKEWYRAIRAKTPISLIMIDIDCFKLYNDHYGHQGGDSCLKKVADGLYSAIHRESDLLARYGGEEFCVVLPDTDLNGAVKVAKEMHQAIQALQIAHPKSRVRDIVSISLGVCTLVPQNDNEPETLIALADQALYKAKDDGRDRVQSVLVQADSN